MEDKSIREAVKERYASIVKHSSSCGCFQTANYLDNEFIGSAGKVAGYSDKELKSIPYGANLGLGCGNFYSSDSCADRLFGSLSEAVFPLLWASGNRIYRK